MGAGVLGIPLFYKSYGIILSTILIIFFMIVTIYSVSCLLFANSITKKSGYSIFAKISYGNIGTLMVKLAIIINNFGVTCAYFRIFGDVSSGIATAFINDSHSNNFFANNWHNWFYILIVGFLMCFFIFKEEFTSLKVRFLYY